ncbi:MAG: hypothetical protein LBU83_12850 [Bacteroidales bacterium]|jgi:hypothetical protein|nr:hypothetical protein [Bacteroidales bacterium]
MKKILLLTLLSAFFLSSFCQNIIGNPEIIAKISIIRSADEDDEVSSNEPNLLPFFWGNVITIPYTDGLYIVLCSGFGPNFCLPPKKEINSLFRGMDQRIVENTFENIYLESEEHVSNGEYRGSISKKIAISDLSGNRVSYILFQMDWNYEPQNPRNGKAEIIISKVNNFEIR